MNWTQFELVIMDFIVAQKPETVCDLKTLVELIHEHVEIAAVDYATYDPNIDESEYITLNFERI